MNWRPPPLVAMPERVEPPDNFITRLQSRVLGLAARATVLVARRNNGLLRSVIGQQSTLSHLSEPDFSAQLRRVREQLRCRGLAEADLGRALAVMCELVRRETGVRMTHPQLQAAKAMLDGHLAELAPGEGKTHALIAASSILAMTGLSVHVVVANEYFVQRDMAIARPIIMRCGLRLQSILRDSDDVQRRFAYGADVLYTCARELAFDYLRDRNVTGAYVHNASIKLRRLQHDALRADETLMRGMQVALIDDADQVLLEQASVPMIISRKSDPADERSWATRAWQLSGALLAEQDFVLDRGKGDVELTPNGVDCLAELCAADDEVWQSVLRREDSVRQALLARHVFERDRHYRVLDGRIRIVDRQTGGLLSDRSWGEGLHQLLEVKEGCEVTGRSVPSSRISYQRLFGRYQHLAGASACLSGARRELWRCYSLAVKSIAPARGANNPVIRRTLRSTDEQAWRELVAETIHRARYGQPVIVVVARQQQAEALFETLQQEGLTSAIVLSDSAAELSRLQALHSECAVILMVGPLGLGIELYADLSTADEEAGDLMLYGRLPTRRLERRLFGLVARRGLIGEAGLYQSMQDPLLRSLSEMLWFQLLRYVHADKVVGDWLLDKAQKRMERLQADARIELAKRERKLSDFLAFAGRGD